MPWISMNYYNYLTDIDVRLSRIERSIGTLMRASELELELDLMAQADIDKLRAQVEKNNQVGESAVTLITGLAAQIREMADDPAELQALAAQLESNAARLGEAISANTPTAPENPTPDTPSEGEQPGQPMESRRKR
jgi:hypothetical protein